MKIRILSSARDDLVEGYWFYEKQYEGLGEYFRKSILEDIDSLMVCGGVHQVIHGKYRMVASHFPHSIFYLIKEDEIRIYAVIDSRRDPNWISDRLN